MRSAVRVVLLLASHLLQRQNLLRRDRRTRVVLVVGHVDVVLAQLVALAARDALAHLAVKHGQTVVHACILLLRVKRTRGGALDVLELLGQLDHHRRRELAHVFHLQFFKIHTSQTYLVMHGDARFLRLLRRARLARATARRTPTVLRILAVLALGRQVADVAEVVLHTLLQLVHLVD